MTHLLDGLPLVDHHCHGIVLAEQNRQSFEAMLTEADAPAHGGTPLHRSLFDTHAGLAVRSLCAPLLDLDRHCCAADYLARRAELGGDDVARRLLGATGIATFLVDTGFRPDLLTSPDALAAFVPGASAHEITRLETLAEQCVVAVEPSAFADEFGARLAATTSVGFKSVAAYRGGLDLDPARPSAAEVSVAIGAWRAAIDVGAPVRLVDPVVIRHLIWTALDLARPVQFHVGYGDSDVDLHHCDPLLLTPLLRATAPLGVPIMLLHNYPFQRHAGYLAQVFDHVFVDVGLAAQNVGSRADVVLAELLELAPFGSVLFSTDGFGLAELYAISTIRFGNALSHYLNAGIEDGSWSAADAERFAAMIGAANARRAYRLGD